MIQMDKMKFKILAIFKVGDVLDRAEKFKKYVETSFQDQQNPICVHRFQQIFLFRKHSEYVTVTFSLSFIIQRMQMSKAQTPSI